MGEKERGGGGGRTEKEVGGKKEEGRRSEEVGWGRREEAGGGLEDEVALWAPSACAARENLPTVPSLRGQKEDNHSK